LVKESKIYTSDKNSSVAGKPFALRFFKSPSSRCFGPTGHLTTDSGSSKMIGLCGYKNYSADQFPPGEPTMNKAELKVYKDQLLNLRARLRGDVHQMAEATLKKNRSEANGDLSSMPIHMADIGSDNFEQEFTLSLMETEGVTLEQIEASLERIEEGTYGQCEECGAKIPKTRLNAIPFATLCIRCAEQQEQGF
jgi:DnaK suppressor protein